MSSLSSSAFRSALPSALLTALALTSTGCARVDLMVLSDNVPGKRADIEVGDDMRAERIYLSSHVALALECSENDPFAYTGPCRDLDVSTDDEDVLHIRPAALVPQVRGALPGYTEEELEGPGVDAELAYDQDSFNQPDRTAVVLLGGVPGSTLLHISTRSAARTLEIEVPAGVEN